MVQIGKSRRLLYDTYAVADGVMNKEKAGIVESGMNSMRATHIEGVALE